MATIDEFKNLTMLKYLELQQAERLFFSTTFFGKRVKYNTAYLQLDKLVEERKLGEYIGPQEESKLVERQGFTATPYDVPIIGHKMAITEIDVEKRMMGEGIYSNVDKNSKVSAFELKDLRKMSSMIDRAIELQTAQLFEDDAAILRNGDQVSYGRTASHDVTLAGADLWTAGTADIYGDLKAWSALIQDDGQGSSTDVVMGSEALDALVNDATMQTLLNNRRTEAGMIEYRNIAPGVKYAGYIAGIGDIWEYRGWYKNTSNVKTYYLDQKKVVMVDRDTLDSEIACAPVASVKTMNGVDRLVFTPAEKFAETLSEKNTATIFNQVKSRPLAVIRNADAVVSAKVLS